MDEKIYEENLCNKWLEHEAMCKRCGACCGVLEGDPCEHLKKEDSGLYFCDIYEDRFGLRKTVSGELILCVPIRNVLHKTWWDKIGCVYYNAYK